MVFIDETWVKTNMRTRGWCTKGAALIDKMPLGHWETLTFIGSMTDDGILAPCVIDGPINGESSSHVRAIPDPELEPGSIEVVHNRGSHKGSRVRTF